MPRPTLGTGTVTRSSAEPGSGIPVLVAAIVGSSMGFIDGTAVNVALPVMQRELHADAWTLQWIVEGYALFLSALILIGGALGDRVGRRAIFLIGIAIFAASSATCAGAWNISILIAARCVQGIGAALFIPGSLALISAAYSGQARGRAIGTWSGFSAITAALGPILGGWLAQSISWRAVFVINIPLAIVVIAVSLLGVRESRDEHASGGLDLGGAALATLGLGAIVYGLIDVQGGARERLDAGIFVVGCLVLAAFGIYESRFAKQPMLKRVLFESRAFVGANLYTLLLYAALGGSMYFLPFDLINVQHYSPLKAGLSLLPFIAVMSLASRWSGGLVARIGARLPLVAGALLSAAAYFGFALMGTNGNYWTAVFPPAFVLGCAGALFVAPLTTTVMSAVDDSDAGIASGINNAASRVAALIAVAGLGFALAGVFEATLARESSNLSSSAVAALAAQRSGALTGHIDTATVPSGDRALVVSAIAAAYVRGFSVAMEIAAGLCIAAAAIAALWQWERT